MIGADVGNPALDSKAENAYQGLLRRANLYHLTQKVFGNGGSHLKSFYEEKEKCNAREVSSRPFTREIDITRIVGSVNKAEDFDEFFRPKKPQSTYTSWKNIYKVWYSKGHFPPVRLYELQGEYYVEDGHHRISVMKTIGVDQVRSEVKKFQVPDSELKEDQVPC